MKTMKYIFGMLLALSCSIQAMAQAIEDGEAFYIYRNDGDFNGFFYDEVQEMRYSKIGIDSLEYDEYMVQEVVTADSIYRIPLCAIDSVGFVQPEIQLNPKLKNIDQSGLTAYVTEVNGWSDESNLSYDSFYVPLDTPEELLPKVGDLVVGFEGPFSDGGCVGTVKYKWQLRDKWRYIIEPISQPSQVFGRFISIEQTVGDPTNSANAKRRIAGYNKIKRAIEGSGMAPLLNISQTLTLDAPFGSKGSASVNVNVNINATLRTVFKIDWSSFFIRSSLRSSLKANPSLTVKGEVSDVVSFGFIDLPGIGVPSVCPIFCIYPYPEAFARYSLDATATIDLPSIGWDGNFDIIIDSEGEKYIDIKKVEQPDAPEMDASGFKITPDFSFNGSAQCGVKLDFGIWLNKWFRRIMAGYIGVEAYMGPKISGRVSLTNPWETNLKLSPFTLDLEAKAKMAYLGQKEREHNFFNTSVEMSAQQWKLVPSGWKLDSNGEEIKGYVDVYTTDYFSEYDYDWTTCTMVRNLRITDEEGSIMCPSKVGFALYRTDYGVHCVEEIQRALTKEDKLIHNDTKFTFSNVYAGTYDFKPLVEIMGVQYVSDWDFPTKVPFYTASGSETKHVSSETDNRCIVHIPNNLNPNDFPKEIVGKYGCRVVFMGGDAFDIEVNESQVVTIGNYKVNVIKDYK